MKKTKLLSVLLLISILLLSGCKSGKNNMKKYAGKYSCDYIKYVGDTEKITDTDCTLELNKDGTGTHYHDGSKYSITWKLDNGNIYITESFLGASLEYSGTVKKKNIQIYNGDLEDNVTIEYSYTKK